MSVGLLQYTQLRSLCCQAGCKGCQHQQDMRDVMDDLACCTAQLTTSKHTSLLPLPSSRICGRSATLLACQWLCVTDRPSHLSAAAGTSTLCITFLLKLVPAAPHLRPCGPLVTRVPLSTRWPRRTTRRPNVTLQRATISRCAGLLKLVSLLAHTFEKVADVLVSSDGSFDCVRLLTNYSKLR